MTLHCLDQVCSFARVGTVRDESLPIGESTMPQLEVLLTVTPFNLIPQYHPIRQNKCMGEGVLKYLYSFSNRVYVQITSRQTEAFARPEE